MANLSPHRSPEGGIFDRVIEKCTISIHSFAYKTTLPHRQNLVNPFLIDFSLNLNDFILNTERQLHEF